MPLGAMKRYDESVAEARRGLEVDPLWQWRGHKRPLTLDQKMLIWLHRYADFEDMLFTLGIRRFVRPIGLPA